MPARATLKPQLHASQTLNGAFVFMADLVRAMQPVPDGMQLDFLRASSYVGATTTGEEAITMGLVAKIPVTGRHIILVEDIVDTGKTLQVRVHPAVWLVLLVLFNDKPQAHQVCARMTA